MTATIGHADRDEEQRFTYLVTTRNDPVVHDVWNVGRTQRPSDHIIWFERGCDDCTRRIFLDSRKEEWGLVRLAGLQQARENRTGQR